MVDWRGYTPEQSSSCGPLETEKRRRGVIQ